MPATSDVQQGHREGLDVARGVLLVAMVAVHVVSAHATAGQAGAMHAWFGIFLISSGFVGLSGFVMSARPGQAARRDWLRAADGGLHLVLVMVAYGVLLSLFEHGLRLAIPDAAGCTPEAGWSPPVRFEDLGILLPIALVRVQSPVARVARPRVAIPVTLALAACWALLPEVADQLPADGAPGWIVGVLAERTLTPFYTVSTFVAVGLACAALARAPLPSLHGHDSGRAAGAVSLAASVALAVPAVSGAVLDPIYAAGGGALGALATLGYWTVAIALFLRGFAAPAAGAGVGAWRVLARVGTYSLLVFVTHDFLLAIDAAVREGLGAGKGMVAVSVMIATNVAAVALLAVSAARLPRVRRAAIALLLIRPREAVRLPGALASPFAALALAGAIAVYTGGALAGGSDDLVIDDFERRECPSWWQFGELSFERGTGDPAQGARYLRVRGRAPGMFAHGRGVFLDRDLGGRETFVMHVRGDGTGSGRIKIEIAEDDNGNWEIEKDPELYTPAFDDRLVHEIEVDWRGWREVEVPLAAFRDDNPRGGNDVLDPARDMTSGGLLELQLLFAPSGNRGDAIAIGIDSVRFTR